MSTLRVLHVIGVMNRGGAETMVMNLYRNIDRNKVQFDFVENTYEKGAYDDEISILGGKIYHCPHYNGKNHLAYVKWWDEFFKNHKKNYQIVHGHIGSTASIYLSIAKKYGLFTIAHSHSAGDKYTVKSILYKIMSLRTRYIADYFFACSLNAGINRYGKRVVSQSNFIILNNAIDSKKFQYDEFSRKKIRMELGYEDYQIIIGNIGRYTFEKNHEFLLKVLKSIRNKNINARFLMIGDGPLHSKMIKLAENYGLSDLVDFTGVRSDINDLMLAMDIFVLPSLYEGLPLTLIEAQATGLTCVMSDTISEEVIIAKDLVSTLSLKLSPEEWADHILAQIKNNCNKKRFSRTKDIVSNGFDISETSKWLEVFYIEKSRK